MIPYPIMPYYTLHQQVNCLPKGVTSLSDSNSTGEIYIYKKEKTLPTTFMALFNRPKVPKITLR